jgi:hypothetical protein
MKKLPPVPGSRFGRWALIEKIPNLKPATWRCVCACGTKRDVMQTAMVTGRSRSCGCATKEAMISFGGSR